MTRVLFIGLGHLGQYFSQVVPKDWEVAGTFRGNLDPDVFSHIKTFHFDSGKTESFPFKNDYDYVVWSLPPFDQYVDLLFKANLFFKKNVKWIYVGSTGVYGEGEITEGSPLAHETSRQICLAKIEAAVLSLEREVFIIRASGLIDERRNPRKWFKDKNSIMASENRLNFVYTKDVARFIVFLIGSKLKATDFNLCASCHPVKREFYQKLLGQQRWKDILLDGKKLGEKRIDNSKSLEVGFKYLVDHDLEEAVGEY